MDKEIEKQGIVDYWTWRRAKSLIDDYKNSDIPLATLMRGDYSEFLPSVGRNLVSELEYSLDTPGAMGVGGIWDVTKNFFKKAHRSVEIQKRSLEIKNTKEAADYMSGLTEMERKTVRAHPELINPEWLKYKEDLAIEKYTNKRIRKTTHFNPSNPKAYWDEAKANGYSKYYKNQTPPAKYIHPETKKPTNVLSDIIPKPEPRKLLTPEERAARKAATRRLEKAAKAQRTPSWLNDDDIAQMEEIYYVRDQLQKIHGKSYHVDHMIPLNGKTVSGLHVPNNLRIMPAFDNMSKGNRWNPSKSDIEALGKEAYEEYVIQKNIVDMFKKGGTE